MLAKYINTVKSWIEKHYWDIALFLLVLLAIIGILGIWRLKSITPPKTTMTIER